MVKPSNRLIGEGPVKTGFFESFASVYYLSQERAMNEKKSQTNVSPQETCSPDDPPLIREINDLKLKLALQDEELRKTSVELGLSQKRFRELYRLAPTGCLFIDSDGRIQDINRAGRQILGRHASHMVRQPFEGFVIEEDRDRFRALISRIPSGGYFENEKVRVSSSENGIVSIRLSGLPLPANDGNNQASLLLTFTGISRPDPEKHETPDPHVPFCSSAENCPAGSPEQSDQQDDPGIGTCMCIAREKLRQLSYKSITVLENEKKMVAREIHDDLGGSLAAVKFLLEDAAFKNGNNDDITETLDKSIANIQKIIKKTKRLSANLRPTILDDLGLKATIQSFCRQLRSAHPGISFFMSINMDEESFEESQKIVIYRIIQEAVVNAVKHSGADTIWLSLSQENDRMRLEINDNGHGVEMKNAGYRLTGIKEKTEICGGAFSLKSSENEGTRLLVTLPAYSVSI